MCIGSQVDSFGWVEECVDELYVFRVVEEDLFLFESEGDCEEVVVRLGCVVV